MHLMPNLGASFSLLKEEKRAFLGRSFWISRVHHQGFVRSLFFSSSLIYYRSQSFIFLFFVNISILSSRSTSSSKSYLRLILVSAITHWWIQRRGLTSSHTGYSKGGRSGPRTLPQFVASQSSEVVGVSAARSTRLRKACLPMTMVSLRLFFLLTLVSLCLYSLGRKSSDRRID